MAKHILIIGDDASLIAQISALLTAADYTVNTQTHSTYNPEQAHAANVILVVIDSTPGDEITIWQTVQRLRLDRLMTHLPLIICTDLAQNKQEMRYYLERRIRFVQKPFVDGSLLAAVNATLADIQTQSVTPKYANGWH